MILILILILIVDGLLDAHGGNISTLISSEFQSYIWRVDEKIAGYLMVLTCKAALAGRVHGSSHSRASNVLPAWLSHFAIFPTCSARGAILVASGKVSTHTGKVQGKGSAALRLHSASP